MRFYVANCTNQRKMINYRLIENRAPLRQPCEPGGQIMIHTKDLTDQQRDSIIEQLSVYGMLMASAINRSIKHVVPLIAQEGTPLSSKQIMAVIQHNRGVKTLEGQESRKKAAIAAHDAMAERTPSAADALEMVVHQEKPATVISGDAVYDEAAPLDEGIRFRETGAQPPPRGRGNRRAA